MRSPWKRLLRRRQGAVMVMALMFACAMTGALWYVIGIGDAIVFRDRMQEAADAAAFSAAVVHARGMNFIVVINVIMFVMTLVYMVLAIITDIAQILQAFFGKPGWFASPESTDCTFGIPCSLNFVGVGSCHYAAPCVLAEALPYIGEILAATNGCCDVAGLADPIESIVADNVFPDYYNVVKRVMPLLQDAQHVTAAWLAPYGAEAAAIYFSTQYTLPGGSTPIGGELSLSLIPDSSIQGALGGNPATGEEAKYRFSANKIGLPVESLKFQELCKRTVTLPVIWVENALGLPSIINTILNAIVGAVADAMASRYCGDGPDGTPPADHNSDTDAQFWGREGSKDVYGAAKNGNDWMQDWAFTFNQKQDTYQSGASLPSRMKTSLGLVSGTPTLQMYVAQAEIYYDCDDTWESDACDAADDPHMAMWTPHWRARLRRVHKPAIASDIFNFGFQALLNSGNQSVISGAIGNAVQGLTGSLGPIGNAVIGGALDKAVGSVSNSIQSGGQSIATSIDGNGVVNTTIH